MSHLFIVKTTSTQQDRAIMRVPPQHLSATIFSDKLAALHFERGGHPLGELCCDSPESTRSLEAIPPDSRRQRHEINDVAQLGCGCPIFT